MNTVPLNFIPAKRAARHRRRQEMSSPPSPPPPPPPPPPPVGFVLTAASYDNPGNSFILFFSEAIDISAVDVNAFQLNDPDLAQWYQGTATPQLIDPTTVRIFLIGLGGSSEPTLLINVAAGNGIVAADDGEVWPGVTNLGLPYP